MKGKIMETCDCGTCEQCQTKAKVLMLAEQRNWAAFAWQPASTIVAGENGWKLFCNNHSIEELHYLQKKMEAIQ